MAVGVLTEAAAPVRKSVRETDDETDGNDADRDLEGYDAGAGAGVACPCKLDVDDADETERLFPAAPKGVLTGLVLPRAAAPLVRR